MANKNDNPDLEPATKQFHWSDFEEQLRINASLHRKVNLMRNILEYALPSIGAYLHRVFAGAPIEEVMADYHEDQRRKKNGKIRQT